MLLVNSMTYIWIIEFNVNYLVYIYIWCTIFYSCLAYIVLDNSLHTNLSCCFFCVSCVLFVYFVMITVPAENKQDKLGTSVTLPHVVCYLLSWYMSAWTQEGLPAEGTPKLKWVKALKRSNQVINRVMNAYL